MVRLLLAIAIFLSLSAQATDTGYGVEYIPNDRSLGIGTPNPNAKLTVNGNVSIKETTAPSQTAGYGKIYVDPTTENLFFLDESGNQYALIPGTAGSVAANGEWLDGGTYLRPADFSGAQDVAIGGTTIANGDTVFYANGKAAFNKQKNSKEFRIKAVSGKSDYAFLVDNNSDGNGNIGLSTSTPRSILDIHNGALTLGKYPEASDPSLTSFNLVTWLTNGNTTGDNGDLMARISRPGSSKYFTIIDFDNFNTPILNGLTLNDLTANRLVKTNNGRTLISETSLLLDSSNIGISIASTNEKLTVNGLLALKGTEAPSSSSGYGKLYVKATDSNLYFMDDSGTEYDLSSALIGTFEWEDTGTEIHPSDESGAENLVIGNTTENNGDIVLEASGAATFNKQGFTANVQIKGSSDANLFFANGSTNNVGIGLSNPSTKLEVSGTIKASQANGSTANLTNLITKSLSVNNFDTNFSNGSIIHSNTSGVLQEDNDQLYWDRQKSQLGIGINSTNEKITINGVLALKEISSPSATTLYGKLYVKSTDSNLYFMDSTGSEFDLLDDSINLGIDDLTDAKANNWSVFLGNDSGSSDDGSNANTSVGVQALNGNTSSTNNVAFGYQALLTNNQTSGSNTAVGSESLKSLKYESGKLPSGTAIGYRALMNTLNGRNNLALGSQAMLKNISGSYNTIAGYQSANGEGSYSYSNNTYLGAESGNLNRNASNNTLVGHQTGFNISNGNENTFLGQRAGYLSSGNQNTLIGYRAGDNITSGSQNLIIGYDTDSPSSTASNQINIANTIYGNGRSLNIGIAIDELEERLTINGVLSIAEISAPSATNSFGKIYVNSSDHSLYLINNGGSIYNLTDNGDPSSISQWTDTSTILHPADLSGEETIVLGGNSIANADIILYNGGGAIFNEQSQNADFRIESGTSSDAFFVDGSADRISLSLPSANDKLTINGALSIREAASSSAFSGYGKLYVDPTTSNLFFLSDSGTATDLLRFNSSGTATSEWTDAGSFLHPSDSSGAEDIVIGNDTISNPETVLKADGSATFNDNQGDRDFRVESDNDANMLLVEGNDEVHIGTDPNYSSINYILNSAGDIRADNLISNGKFLSHWGSNTSTINTNVNSLDFRAGPINFDLSNGTNSYFDDTDLSLNNNIYFIESTDNVGVKYSSPNEALTINGTLSIAEQSAPGTSANFGKLYGKTDGKLYFKNSSGTEYDLTCNGSSSEWEDGGNFLYPTDNSGVQDIIIGATSLASADIILRANGTTIFNEQSADADFTVQSQTSEAMFFVDASTSNIGIRFETPNEKLTVNGMIALREMSKPSSSSNQGKLYVDSNTSNLFFLNSSGVAYDLLKGNGQLWSENSFAYYPSTSSKSVVIGGETKATADIIIDSNGSATFNEQGNNVNFQVGTGNDLFVNGSTGFVGIGLRNPIEALTLDEAWIFIDAYNTEPGITANYGKLWVDSADSLLYFKNDLGNTYNLTRTVGALHLDDLNDAKATGVSQSIYLGQLAGNGDPGGTSILDNIAVGVNPLKNIAPLAKENIAIGYNALDRFKGSFGSGYNVAIGYESLSFLWANPNVSRYNVSIGTRSMQDAWNSSYDLAIGNGALSKISAGYIYDLLGIGIRDRYNTAIGNDAFTALVNGTFATALGHRAGANLKSAHRTLIVGDNNDAPTVNGNYLMDFADLFYMKGSSKAIGINEANPQRPVHVNDVMRIEPQTSPPTAVEGKLYVDNSGALCLYMNSNWVRLGGSGTCT